MEVLTLSVARYQQAYFPDFEGPFYTTDATKLTRLLDPHQITIPAIQILGETIEGLSDGMYFRPSDQLTTSDGYTWFYTLRFGFSSESSFLIAIPRYGDHNRHGGTDADRSVAFYRAGIRRGVVIETAQLLVGVAGEILTLACLPASPLPV